MTRMTMFMSNTDRLYRFYITTRESSPLLAENRLDFEPISLKGNSRIFKLNW